MKRANIKNKIQKTKRSKSISDELLSEYDFDFTQARSNRFAQRIITSMRVIVLDSDVAKVFKTNEAVNSTLRSFLKLKSRSKIKPIMVS